MEELRDVHDLSRHLERERDEAREELRKASVEANTLATSIQKAEYPDAKDFELLDSVAGVISQIDNMYAGVRQQRDEARQQRDRLAEALEKVIRCHHDQPCTAIVLQQDDEIKRLREALQSLTTNEP
jgi:septal ring factor EnvC (AmiA/AmiB activator)